MTEKKILKLFGCDDLYHLQLQMHGYDISHRTSADDVVRVIKWLDEKGFGIIKKIKKRK